MFNYNENCLARYQASLTDATIIRSMVADETRTRNIHSYTT
jgi:hypothetical protein